MENLDSLIKLGQIIVVDLVLAGDNAIVIGLVAAQFTAEHRRRVIFYGVAIAVVLRIVFAILTVHLLAIKGLMLAGGLLLVWICWKMWVGLRKTAREAKAAAAAPAGDGAAAKPPGNAPIPSSMMQIAIADISMSLDNVLAVAGIADGHLILLTVGLLLSVTFMLFAATLIADLLQKHRWIGYLGLAIIVYVAGDMIHQGLQQLGVYAALAV